MQSGNGGGAAGAATAAPGAGGAEFEMIRIAQLQSPKGTTTARLGVFGCCPEAQGGCTVTFTNFSIKTGLEFEHNADGNMSEEDPATRAAAAPATANPDGGNAGDGSAGSGGNVGDQQQQQQHATRFFLVRHGTTEWNKKGLWQGEIDTPLAPEGEAEARKQGALFCEEERLAFTHAVCSDLKRAHRTAEILAAPHKITPVPAAELRECSLGIFEGMQKDEIHGPKYADIFARLGGLAHQDRINASYFEGLETPAAMSARVEALLRRLAREAGNAEKATILCVTHSTILESVLATLFGKWFVGIDMRRLAWLECRLAVGGAGDIELVRMDGVECKNTISSK